MSPTTIGKPPKQPPRLPGWLGRALCMVGWHDFEVLDVSFGFGPGETIERVECRRCRLRVTRKGKR